MNKGAKPKGKVKIKWSSDFAYAIGLLATDGCLSGDGRHILFTSKDLEQIDNFLKALGIKDVKKGKSYSKGSGKKIYYNRVQFGDVLFYRFLMKIGLTPAKSRTINKLKIPDKFFLDFLRGCFDGDGSIYSYWDSRWKSSFMLYTSFVSASKKYILWLQDEINRLLNLKGHITMAKKKNYWYQLKYPKKESLKLINAMYKKPEAIYLKRKKLKIDSTLDIIRAQEITS